MRKRTRLLALLLALTLLAALPVSAGAAAKKTGTPLQDCHKVTLTHTDTTQENKSVVRVWSAKTALPEVDEELDAITSAWADEIGPTLPKAANKTEKNSRVDIEIRYSRTGLTWMSFVLQARTTYHRKLTGQAIATRTFDMTTGERIRLTDIFDADSEAWALLADSVRETCAGYFPDEEADEAALAALCARSALEETEFSLHGMSLVLHIPAEKLYPEHFTLMEVTLFYPDIRPMMTEKAQEETDNLTYYATCALTFDDGPTRTNTTLVLQSLMETGSRATFFVIGNRIKTFADLVQREHDEGHAIGTHNWTHANVTKISAANIRSMPKKCRAAMIAAIGIPERYDRVPYGLYPQMVKNKVGWSYIQWSLDTYDWRGRKTATVLKTVKDQIDDGDIILCHDIKDNTPASAKAVANWLQENGYMLLTVDELMAKDGVSLEPDTVYYRCKDGDTSKKSR